MNSKLDKRILVAITGASGTIYAERLIDFLLPRVDRIYLILTETAEKVARHELTPHSNGFSLISYLKDPRSSDPNGIIRNFKNDDLFAPIASGSSAPTAMIITPCSMGTLGRISHGTSSNLIERSADVMLKQKKNLIFCPRETPLNLIHVKNLETLLLAGAQIIPPVPAFYQKPKDLDDLINFIVGKQVEGLGFEEHELYKAWNTRLV